jgi:hypothetical protein
VEMDVQMTVPTNVDTAARAGISRLDPPDHINLS